MMENQGIREVPRRAYGLQEVATALGVSTPFVRLEVARGRLKAIRLGRRVLVRAEELERYLALGGSRAH